LVSASSKLEQKLPLADTSHLPIGDEENLAKEFTAFINILPEPIPSTNTSSPRYFVSTRIRAMEEKRRSSKQVFKLIKREENQIKETRKLRSAITGLKNKKLKCHICRQKKNSGRLSICTNFKQCHHAFCQDCIKRNFKSNIKKEYLKSYEKLWPCFICRGVCKCNRCKQSLIDELNLLNEEKLNKSISVL